jgi:hypothetical protein
MVRILAMREIISKALDLGLKCMIMLVGSRQIEKKKSGTERPDSIGIWTSFGRILEGLNNSNACNWTSKQSQLLF